MIPPSEVCLYGHINWSLAQAHSVGLSPPFPPKRSRKARPQTVFQFTVQKRPMSGSVPGASGASLPKWPHLDIGNEGHPNGKKSAGSTVPTSSNESRRKGGHAGGTPDVPRGLHLFIPPHHLHLQHLKLVCFSNFLINGEALHPTGLCLKWFWATIFSFRSHPPLFCDFWHFNVKVAAAHHPVIQKEVDELLAKGAIEPSSGGAGFYSSAFVVPKHTGGLRPILSLKHFKCFLHIPSFKMPTLQHVWQLIQQGDYAFSIDLQDAYLHVPIVKHHHDFLHFVWLSVPYQWKVLPFGLATDPRVFTSPMKPILFLCHCKGLHIVIYLDDILVLIHSKQAGKRACLFLCSL